MSLANTVIQPSAGFLMSDGGMWDKRGRLLQLFPKLLAPPAIKAAVTVRGSAYLPLADWAILEGIDSQGALFDVLPEYVRALKKTEVWRYAVAGLSWQDLEVTVVFWDQRRSQPRARQFNTAPPGKAEGYAAHAANYAPYAWYDLPSLTLAPTIPAWSPSWPKLSDLQNESAFDVRACAADIVTAQREARAGAVGGWVDMATVTACGVAVERIVAWPEDVPVPTARHVVKAVYSLPGTPIH